MWCTRCVVNVKSEVVFQVDLLVNGFASFQAVVET